MILIGAQLSNEPSRERHSVTRAAFVTVAVAALNVYFAVTHGGEFSEVGLVGLLLAGGFNVGSFFDAK